MLLRLPMRSPPSDRAPYSQRTVSPWRIAAGNRRRYARKKYAAWLRPTGRTGSAPLTRRTGPLGEPDADSGADSGATPGANRGASGSGSSDVWVTLGHTASMSPDERARRGLTPPDSQGTDADALEREALASTGAAPLSSAASSAAARAAAALPVEDTRATSWRGCTRAAASAAWSGPATACSAGRSPSRSSCSARRRPRPASCARRSSPPACSTRASSRSTRPAAGRRASRSTR